MRKIFITGICGFVGSSLASFFYNKNCKVYGIDNLYRKGSHKNYLKLKKRGVKVFTENLCDKNIIKKFLKYKKFDDLIHCAAYTSVLDGVNSINATEL